MPKSKKTRETSLDLAPLFKTSFKTSVDARVVGLNSHVDYLENWRRSFIEKKYDRKRCLPRTHVLFSELQFFFLYGLFTPLTAKGKKRINKALSKHSKQFLLLFYFLV